MNNITSLPKFHPGDKAYMHHGRGSCFLVKIQDVYRYNGKWYYDVDASRYAVGLVLEFVNEHCLTKRGYDNPGKRVSSRLLKKLSEQNRIDI